jgi:hypothetical protein
VKTALSPRNDHRSLPQYSISLLLLAMYTFAICLTKDLGGWWFLLLVQPILLWVVLVVLYTGIPRRLLDASDDNTYRVDGSRSDRRMHRETEARRQLKTNLSLLIVNVALGGTLALVATIHLYPNDHPTDRLFAIGLVTFFWLVGGFLFLQSAYMSSMTAFLVGVRERNEDYLRSDIERMQRKIAS